MGSRVKWETNAMLTAEKSLKSIRAKDCAYVVCQTEEIRDLHKQESSTSRQRTGTSDWVWSSSYRPQLERLVALQDEIAVNSTQVVVVRIQTAAFVSSVALCYLSYALLFTSLKKRNLRLFESFNTTKVYKFL